MNNNISLELQEAREDVEFHRKRADLLEARVTALVRQAKAAEELATAAELSTLDGYNLLYAAADELQRAGYMEKARRLRQKANKEREALRQWREVSQ